MDRRTFVASAFAFATCPQIHAHMVIASNGRPMSSDVNAIYSKVLLRQCRCCRNRNGPWLIDAYTYSPPIPIVSTKVITPMGANSAVGGTFAPSITPPADRLEEALLLVEDLKKRVEKPSAISTHLKVPRAYRLVTPEEHRLLQILHPGGNVYDPSAQARAAAVPEGFRRQFDHAGEIDSLGPIAFNPKHSLALVSYRTIDWSSVSETCYILETLNGHWRLLDWQNTGTSSIA